MKRRPIIIAHRGARNLAPENTLPAFRRAIELGAEGIEFDVLLSSDGIPVVTHNDDLETFTSFKGHAHDTPYNEIARLDAGSYFGSLYANTHIPTLVETLNLILQHDICAIVEIKGQLGFLSKAAQVIGGLVSKFKGGIIVSSVNIHILHEISKLYPKIPLAAIIIHPAFSFFVPNAYAKIPSMAAIHPSVGALSQRMIKQAHDMNWKVHVWTVNDEAAIDRCLGFDVDGIMTDDVAFARRCIEEKFANARR